MPDNSIFLFFSVFFFFSTTIISPVPKKALFPLAWIMEIPDKEIDKQELIKQIRNSTEIEIDDFLKCIIKEKLSQEKDHKRLYEFFTYIYDNLYHDIILKKISISKHMEKILGTLATPISNRSTIDGILKKL